MNASVGILNPSILTRIIFSQSRRQLLFPNPRHGRIFRFDAVHGNSICSVRAHSYLSSPLWTSVTLGSFSPPFLLDSVNFLKSDPNENAYSWRCRLHSNRQVKAVLLDWPGAELTHLKSPPCSLTRFYC